MRWGPQCFCELLSSGHMQVGPHCCRFCAVVRTLRGREGLLIRHEQISAQVSCLSLAEQGMDAWCGEI